MEERIYRLRCVEGWSMVIPWVGYSLAELIKHVEPTGNAKYVEFVTLADPKTDARPCGSRVLDWPYVEGLRMDEAMHPLTLLALRHVRRGAAEPERRAGARWSCRGSTASRAASRSSRSASSRSSRRPAGTSARRNEYGFYSNVNPKVDHPRWSQATERRIGEDGFFAKKRPTLMFNGYEAQVGSLYAGHGPEEELLTGTVRA